MKITKLTTLLLAFGLLLTGCGANQNNDKEINPEENIPVEPTPSEPVVDPIPVDPTPDTSVAVTGVSLNSKNIILTVYDECDLSFVVSPSNATNKNVYWTSSDNNVVSVNNGHIKALKPGSASITIKTVDGNFSDSCSVTVNPISNVTKIEVDRIASSNNNSDCLAYYYNETFTSNGIVVMATYNNGKQSEDVAKDCVFSNTEIVYDDDAKGKYITITHIPSGVSCQCWINIYIPTEENVAVTKVEIDDLEMQVGQTKTITAKINPSITYWKEVVWSIEDSSIATINASTGEIKALKTGSTTITATSIKYSSKKDTCVLTVIDAAHDHGYKTASEISSLALSLSNPTGKPFVNSAQTVTIKAKALDVLAFVATNSEDGGDTKPTKVLLADETGYVMAASGTGDNDLAAKAKKYLQQPQLGSSYYTVTGTVAMYRGVPEIQVTSFSWSETAHCSYNVIELSEQVDTAAEMFEYTEALNISTKGMASGKLVKTTATCVYQVDDNGSYLFRDGNNNTFNVYKPFGADFSINKEYNLAGLLTMYNYRTSLRAIESSLTGNTPSQFDIKTHAVNTSIKSLYDIQSPSGTTVDVDYMKSNSTIYTSEVFVDAYVRSDKWDFIVADDLTYDFGIADSKNNVVGSDAVWISNENYWAVNPSYYSKGILSEYSLANRSEVTEENIDTYKVRIYYTLSLLNTDTGVSGKSAWKISIIENLIPHYGVSEESQSDVLNLSNSAQKQTGYVWQNGAITLTTTSGESKTGYTHFAKVTTFTLSSSKKITAFEIVFTQTYAFINSDAYKNAVVSVNTTTKTHTVALNTASKSYSFTSNSEDKSRIVSITVYYANEA